MQTSIVGGIPSYLPDHPGIDESVDHAPNRRQILSRDEKRLALRNALRYIPPAFHRQLAPEFLEELNTYGRILMRRYRPTSYPMKAYPIDTTRQKASKLHRSC